MVSMSDPVDIHELRLVKKLNNFLSIYVMINKMSTDFFAGVQRTKSLYGTIVSLCFGVRLEYDEILCDFHHVRECYGELLL
jgi:hypothetical protein